MFYLYALPTGTLGSQIETLRATCKDQFGLNKAHKYPVHVTLTRGFSLEAERVDEFREALSRHFAAVRPFHVGGLKHIARMQLVVLELESDGIAEATSAWTLELGRPDIEVVDAQFHVTIAWQTPSHGPICELAQKAIDCSMGVEWKIALCERLGDAGPWQCYDGVVLR